MQLNGPVCHIVLSGDCQYLLGKFIDLMAKDQSLCSLCQIKEISRPEVMEEGLKRRKHSRENVFHEINTLREQNGLIECLLAT